MIKAHPTQDRMARQAMRPACGLMPKAGLGSAQGQSAPINPSHDPDCSAWPHKSAKGENSRRLVPAEGLGAVAYGVEIAGDGS
jgi:hypothetical protein